MKLRPKIKRTPSGGYRLQVTVDPAHAVLDEAAGTFNGLPLLPAASLTVSDAGCAFLQSHEGTRQDAAGRHILYDDDGGGHCTIGYGHLVHHGLCTGTHVAEAPFLQGLDEGAAHALFVADIAPRVAQLRRYCGPARLTQNMFDAVFSLHYNVNTTANWRLYKALKAGDYARAAMEFDVVTSSGMLVRGLVRRRLAEVRVFLG